MTGAGFKETDRAGVQLSQLAAQTISNSGAPSSESAGVQQVAAVAGASTITGFGASSSDSQGAQTVSQGAISMTGAGASSGNDAAAGVQGFSTVITITAQGGIRSSFGGKQSIGTVSVITQAGIESLSAYGSQALANPFTPFITQKGAPTSEQYGFNPLIPVPTSSSAIVALVGLDTTKAIAARVVMGNQAIAASVGMDSSKMIAAKVTTGNQSIVADVKLDTTKAIAAKVKLQ
jgi:hypothetical protein